MMHVIIYDGDALQATRLQRMCCCYCDVVEHAESHACSTMRHKIAGLVTAHLLLRNRLTCLLRWLLPSVRVTGPTRSCFFMICLAYSIAIHPVTPSQQHCRFQPLNMQRPQQAAQHQHAKCYSHAAYPNLHMPGVLTVAPVCSAFMRFC
jgi:hypothetical protein